jgi:hypothetical protein
VQFTANKPSINPVKYEDTGVVALSFLCPAQFLATTTFRRGHKMDRQRVQNPQ